ncbi:hypothetical protein NDI44_12935 [Trichocoleus sp. DQ-A3]|uniref:hypothetical protein n=2 Tax=Cyanophyceae TaxID=3028117 RepID=UPI00168592B4|nr:hypothetical protein [Coleofasciculus sp. FACHB-125]
MTTSYSCMDNTLRPVYIPDSKKVKNFKGSITRRISYARSRQLDAGENAFRAVCDEARISGQAQGKQPLRAWRLLGEA